MKKGDKLICLKTIKNLLGKPLFKKGEIYEILFVDNEDVKVTFVLNHIQYGNEYAIYDMEFVTKNFKIVNNKNYDLL